MNFDLEVFPVSIFIGAIFKVSCQVLSSYLAYKWKRGRGHSGQGAVCMLVRGPIKLERLVYKQQQQKQKKHYTVYSG
jgi:hypothetical protein